MKVRTTNPFKVGAVVRIVVPRFVVRVGYPMAVHQEARRLTRERGAELDAFLRQFGLNPNVEPHQRFQDSGGPPKVRAVQDIAKALAYELCQKNKWGGTARTVHAVEVPRLAGSETDITGARSVKTGQYCAGGISGGYYGTGEPEPPYLANERTHRLLETRFWAADYGIEDYPRGFLEVEAENVELVRRAE